MPNCSYLFAYFCAHGYANYLIPHGRMSVMVCTRDRVQSACRASDFAHFAHARRVLCIISFKPPSHAIIQFSLRDNDHVILIWQVDYTAYHTRLLMLRERLELLCGASRLDGLLQIALADCFCHSFSNSSFLSLIWKKPSLFSPISFNLFGNVFCRSVG